MKRNTNSLVSESDKSTFSVFIFRDSEVNGFRRVIHLEGELDRFDFCVLDLAVELEGLS
jgi:hypothetical protein